MRSYRLPLVLMTLGALAVPAPAGIFFNRKPNKPNPAQRVPELIYIVKMDQNESKRAAAAEELRQFDVASQPDIIPILVDVLMNDSKAGVRASAAESLGKLRPISEPAGWALEQAVAKDASMRVRLQARYALLQYHWSGYHSAPKTGEPPLGSPAANPGQAVAATTTPAMQPAVTPTITPVQSKGGFAQWFRTRSAPARRPSGESPPPPLADPSSQAPRPMVVPPGAPSEPPTLPRMPTPASDQGPDLSPPPQ